MKKLIFAAALMLLTILFTLAISASEEVPVSPGLCVLATNTDMAKAAIVGDNIGFTADDFKRALNLSSIDMITVKTLPGANEGTLRLGNATIAAGQGISEENLNLLTFVPSSDKVKSGSFVFSNGNGYSIKCNLHFIEKTNYSPTVSLAKKSSLTINTHDMVSKIGELDAYDPEGDKFVYEIVSYPKNGSLVLLDREDGRYVYTPLGSFTGSDSFSYVARDIYGNYSAKAEISVNVKERTTSVIFGDIDSCNIYNAALTMAENSLMSGTEIDGVTYFSPEQSISRAEFLSAAMQAAGINDPGTATKTFFHDDEDIPGKYKGYVWAAYQMGIINGSEIDGKTCFLPNATITRAEAAVMLTNILSNENNIEEPVLLPVFADVSQLPSWASDAIYSMNSLGVLQTLSGYASPEETVTRGDAAQMLEAVINLYK